MRYIPNLQALYAVILYRVGHGNTDARVVLMTTYTFDLQRTVIQEKAFVGIHIERTETDAHGVAVDNRIALYNFDLQIV